MQVKLLIGIINVTITFSFYMVMFVKQCLSNLLVQSDALCIHLQDNFGFVSSYMSFFGEKSILL